MNYFKLWILELLVFTCFCFTVAPLPKGRYWLALALSVAFAICYRLRTNKQIAEEEARERV